MSRTSALWSAAILTIVFMLFLGGVVLRPVLTANADEAGNVSPGTVVSDQWDDDDEGDQYEDDDGDEHEDDDDEHEDDDYEDEDDDHEDEDEDDDD